MTTIDNSMEDRICMVTGATNGIGLVTAQALAQMGAEVIVVGRSEERGAAAIERIKNETDSDKVSFMLADLSSQADIHKLADDFKARYNRLHVLVNNAGAYFTRRHETVDGIEMTFALNHLGYFLLTNLLLDVLEAGAEPGRAARVVNVSSGAHAGAQLNFDDLEAKRRFSGWQAYGRSKLANIYFTNELANRINGQNITANSLHPGFVASNFGLNNNGILRPLMRLVQLFALSMEEGAQTSIYLATSPEVEGVTGQYFSEMKVAGTSKAAQDAQAAKRLWQISEEMTGLA